MKKIEYRVIQSDNVDFLRNLCNQLMQFQADHAKIRPDIMGSMNYDNRLKPEFKGSDKEYMVVAYDEDSPIGFAYGTIGEVTEQMMSVKPAWASELEGLGFFPSDYDVPKSIGTFKLLYVSEEYRGYNAGKKLTEMVMKWLRDQDVEDLWVYVANGNEKVGKFYEKYGFKFSHNVYQGFIEAYCQKKST